MLNWIIITRNFLKVQVVSLKGVSDLTDIIACAKNMADLFNFVKIIMYAYDLPYILE